MSLRPDTDEYFLKIASVVAERSTCHRHHVGAVAVRDKHILATGYNGAPSGLKDCLGLGCLELPKPRLSVGLEALEVDGGEPAAPRDSKASPDTRADEGLSPDDSDYDAGTGWAKIVYLPMEERKLIFQVEGGRKVDWSAISKAFAA